MAVDTPATIAIFGAGPIGLEAALYARYLGYDVRVYERGRVAEHLLRWGHVRLFTPFGHNASPLGRAALAAQGPDRPLPPLDALLTGRELVEAYYQPLAASDLLVDSIQPHTEVISVGRTALRKTDLVEEDVRADFDFRILLRDAHGGERFDRADVVIDATGTYGQPRALGAGGIPAIGEQALAARIEYGLPDVLGTEREHYVGRRTLVVGCGHAAATTVLNLSRLGRQSQAGRRETKIVWVTRPRPDADSHEPVRRLTADPLPLRDELAAEANRLAAVGTPELEYRGGTEVEKIAWNAESAEFTVDLIGAHAGPITVDRIVANVGYEPNREIYRQLEADECFATEATRGIGAILCGENESTANEGKSARRLLHPEPDFYVLGAKSHGRDSRLLIADGLAQIRDLFTMIGDRDDLNLYATAARLESSSQ